MDLPMMVYEGAKQLSRVEYRQPIAVDRLLEWTYRQQLADIGGGTAAAGSGVWEMIQMLGTRVDVSGYATRMVGGCGGVHEDALIVHERLSGVLRPPEAGLVIRHARTGSVPEAHAPPVRRWRREPVARVAGRGAYQFCPTELLPLDADIAFDRMIYDQWRAALVVVAEALEDQPLRRWLVGMPSAPGQPWCLTP